MSERDDTVEQVFYEPNFKDLGTSNGGYVEMGDQLFTPAEWEVVQAYARGFAISQAQDAAEATSKARFSTRMQAQVAEFHKAFNSPVGDTVRVLPADRVGVRIELLREEFLDELIPALEAGDIVETADACIDILYVTFGLLVEMGIDAGPLFDEVQRSNMSKLGADGKPMISRGMAEDGFYAGRVMKGPGYFRPELAGLLLEQMEDTE